MAPGGTLDQRAHRDSVRYEISRVEVAMDVDNKRASTNAQIERADRANKVQDRAEQQTDNADRRDELAEACTVSAPERNYAACGRTGLALASDAGTRVMFDKVVAPRIGITGSDLILFNGVRFAKAAWRQISKVAPPRPEMSRIHPVLLSAFNSFPALVSLIALVGVRLR